MARSYSAPTLDQSLLTGGSASQSNHPGRRGNGGHEYGLAEKLASHLLARVDRDFSTGGKARAPRHNSLRRWLCETVTMTVRDPSGRSPKHSHHHAGLQRRLRSLQRPMPPVICRCGQMTA